MIDTEKADLMAGFSFSDRLAGSRARICVDPPEALGHGFEAPASGNDGYRFYLGRLMG